MYRSIFFIMIVSCLTAVSCATHNGSPVAKSSIEGVSAQEKASSGAQFVLGQGDEVVVQIWRYSDLKRTVHIDPSGYIYLPLAGDIKASGLTIPELKKEVTARMSPYIKDPKVDINLTGIASQKVHVFGEVTQTGSIVLDKSMGPLDAISESGGFSRDADKSKVLLLREGHGGSNEVNVLNFDFNKVGEDLVLSRNTLLRDGDILYVPPLRIADLETFMGRLNTILSPLISLERGIALWPEVSDVFSGDESDDSGVVVVP